MLTAEMEKKISMLAVLGTLGPMIGLLGTLKGMIASFSVIAMSATQIEGQPRSPGYFRSPRADVRGGGVVGAGDLLFRRVPQPGVDHFRDRPDAGRTSSCGTLPGRPGEAGRRPAPAPRRKGGAIMSGAILKQSGDRT